MAEVSPNRENKPPLNKTLTWKRPGKAGLCRFGLVDCLSANPPYSRRMAVFVPVGGRFRASKPPWANLINQKHWANR